MAKKKKKIMGYMTNPDGTRTPVYEGGVEIVAKRTAKDSIERMGAPIRTDMASNKTQNNTQKKAQWFSGGALDDGYDFGDITKTILGTTADIGVGVAQGAMDSLEGIKDLGVYGVAGVADFFGADKFADKARKHAMKSDTAAVFDSIYDTLDPYSMIEDKGRNITRGIGQVGLMLATGGAGTAAKLGTKAVSGLIAGTMGASSMGSAMGEAYQSGADDVEALKYGAMVGAVDAGTEMLFGGLGKTVRALGISKGISSLDDAFAQKLSSKIVKNVNNQFAKRAIGNTVEYGVKAGAEGVEEILAGVGSAVAKKLTYLKDEDLKKLVDDEDLLDQFVTGAVTSGIAQGGDFISSVKSGRDYVTGLTANEQKVVDKEIENRIKEKESDGKKLTNKEKGEIEEKVINQLKEGAISVDTIEKTLAGDTYKKHQSAIEREKELQDEYEVIRNTPKDKLSYAQEERYAELKSQLENLESSKLKEQLDSEMKNLTEKDDYLLESYNERERGKEAFTADLSKYDEKQRKIVQNAIDCGELNNRRSTHKVIDWIAKIAGEKGIDVDFTTNERLKESLLAIQDGQIVNGYTDGGKVTLNLESAKVTEAVIGHEITHVFEGTELYDELSDMITKYATANGTYKSTIEALKKTYRTVYDENSADYDSKIQKEFVADFIGDTLFTDENFIRKLSEKPTLFGKIYDEIKYLVKSSKGTEAEQKLLDIERQFEKVYREMEVNKDGGAKYSLKIAHTDGTTEELENARNITPEQAKEYLLQAKTGELKRSTYIPVRKDTPQVIIDTLEQVNEKIENRSLVMQVRKARQSMAVDRTSGGAKKHGSNVRNHGLSPEEIVEIVNNLDNPNAMIYQTERYDKGKKRLPNNVAVFVDYSFNGREGMAVIEFDSSINPEAIGEDFGDTDYHTVVTVFEPDAERNGTPFDYAEELLQNPNNIELEIKRRQPSRSATGEKHPNTSSELPSNVTISQDSKKSNGNLQFSISGINSKTHDLSLLEQAIKMEDIGKASSEKIRQQTGWFRGYDGKWRYEIDDSKSELIENPKLEKHVDESGETYFTGKLSNILKHDDLYEAYPQLRDVNIVIQTTSTGVSGVHQPSSNCITLSLDLFQRYTKEYEDILNNASDEIKKIEQTPEFKEYNKWYEDEQLSEELGAEKWLEEEKKARDKFYSSEIGKRYHFLTWGRKSVKKLEFGWNKAAKKVLMHEIQHAVQKIEGFASGASVEFWKNISDEGFTIKTEGQRAELRKVETELKKMWEEDPVFFSSMSELVKSTPDMPRGEVDWDTLEQIEEDPIEWQEYDKKRDALVEKYGDKVYAFMRFVDRRENLQKQGITPNDAYYKTAGEIEARDVASRTELTDAQRKEQRPDIDRTDVVFASHPIFGRNNGHLSLSNQNTTPLKGTNGRDLMLNKASLPDDIPIRQDIALQNVQQNTGPVKETVQDNANTVPGDFAQAVEVEDIEELHRQQIEELDQQISEVNANDVYVSANNKSRVNNFQSAIEGYKNARAEIETTFDNQISKKQSEYDSLKRKDTKRATNLLMQIENLKLRKANNLSAIDSRIKNAETRVDGIVASDRRAVIMNDIKSSFEENGLDLDEVLRNAKNLSTIATVDNTPQRVMDKTFGWEAGHLLSNLTINRVAQNETEGIKWVNENVGLLKSISKEYNIKPRSKESAAAQMYAEGFYLNEAGELVKYGDAELEADFDNASIRENIKALAKDTRIREIYDDALDRVNESRVRNGYPAIPKRQNYFLHFMEMNDAFSRLGIPFNPNDIHMKDLPTDLNGMTADLKPGQPYFASSMQRKGHKTTYDLIGGVEKYLNNAKNQAYHIDDIQTFRALRNYIADMFGQAKGLEDIDSMSDAEANERIQQVYGSHLSNFAKFLNEEANVLAGKTALIDRGLEGIIGRKGLTFMNTLNSQVGTNAVGWNIGSGLTNIIPLAETFAKSNKFDFVKAFTQTVSNKIGSIHGKTDGFAEKNPGIIRRKGIDKFSKTPFEKMRDSGYILMSAVDDVTTEVIIRTKYNELTRKGMAENEAHIESDKWAHRILGDRSLGQMPQVFNSKTLGPITKFQLEVRNQLDSMLYDTIQEGKHSQKDVDSALQRNANTAAKITSVLIQNAIAQHFVGTVLKNITGYNPTFDIAEVLMTAFGLDDDDESEDTAMDNLEQGVLALLEDMPYSSVVLDGGRIPISSALPITEFIQGKDEYGLDKSRVDIAKEALPYYILPTGYGQLKKTAQGLRMFDDDLPISGSYNDSGKLRFPVEDTAKNKVRAGLFGQWANKNAKDYFDNNREPLSEKQIKEYKDLDLPIQDYWDYRENLKEQETTADKVDYIAGLDLPISKKNIMVNNAVKRKKRIDLSKYDKFSDFEEFDWFSKNKKKYNFLKENGITYNEYKKSEKTKEEYDNAYNWYKDNPESVAVAKTITDNMIEYRSWTKDIYNIKSDLDANGKSVYGSAKKKKKAYINNLDIDDGQKAILIRSLYDSKEDKQEYDGYIVNYVINRNDLSFNEKVSLLRGIGITVDDDGTVRW